MRTHSPDRKETTNILVVGPPSSGRTTSLILLHTTIMDYHDQLKCIYTPNLLSENFDLFREANELILYGKAPSPAPDLKVELQLRFRGGLLRQPKHVNLLFGNLAGPITNQLVEVFPEIVNRDPMPILDRFTHTGLDRQKIEYLVKKVLSADGLLLIVDSSKLLEPHSLDLQLGYLLINILRCKEDIGGRLQQIGLLFTKYDQIPPQRLQPPDDGTLRRIASNYLPQLYNIISHTVSRHGTNFKMFYSGLEETSDEEGESRFSVNTNAAGRLRRLKYNSEQYLRLVEWLRDT